MSRTQRIWSLGTCRGLFSLAAALLVPAGLVSAQGYEGALARYQECIKRVPFRHHVEARETLARTGQPQALKILVKDYKDSAKEIEQARYTIASMLGQHFDTPEALQAVRQLREEHDKPTDIWLWVKALEIEANRDDSQRVVDIAVNSKNYAHRAAAILALGADKSLKLDTAILQNCVEFPRNEADRNLLLGAMASAIYDNRLRINDEPFRQALRAYANLLLDDMKLTDVSKLQIARHLQLVLKSPKAYAQAEPWLRILEREEIRTDKSANTVTAPRFFGIESDGLRFCYVIDLSDSMCREIHPSVRPKGPVTGAKPKKRPKGVLPDESDLPWHAIETRFDLAREQLKISLQRLSPDQQFSIVIFGTKAETLRATPGMVKASKGNIKRAIKDLDNIKIGPKDAVKSPDGTLRGMTNLHGGLRVAFGLSSKGYVDQNAYVDPATLTQGCDTIFLLSDGSPSTDDFVASDKDYGEGRVVVDQEYGAEAARTPTLNYHGPYVDISVLRNPGIHWLVDDVRRMNAFRRVRLHCIGIGEANFKLLKDLAEIGHGEVIVVGRKAQERTGG